MISSVSSPYHQQQLSRPQTPVASATDQELPAVQAEAADVTDTVSFSTTAKSFQSDQQEAEKAQNPQEDKAQGTDEENLDEDEKRQVDQLKKRDQEVKAHERAHMAAGGGLVQGGASYTYQRGPDGGMYAVGGEVSIDTSSENDPDQTIQKMEQVKRAALAPAQPSGTDRAVAAQAAQIQLQAQMQKTQESQEEGENPEAEDTAAVEGAKIPGEGDDSKENESVSINTTQESGDAEAETQNGPKSFGFNSQEKSVGGESDGTEAVTEPPDKAYNRHSAINPYANVNQALFVGQQLNISA